MSRAKLADLCELVSDQVDPQNHAGSLYIGLEHIASGRCARIGAGVAADVQSSKFSFKKGDVLYGKLRPYLDKAVLADSDGICTTELLVLRPRDGVDSRFLVSILHDRAFIDHAMSGITGTQHPRTSWNRVSEFDVPQLEPLEQRRIGGAVWAVHRAVSLCEEALGVAEQLKILAMRELFTLGIRGEPQKETEIGPVPESWDVVRLGSLGRIGNGSTPKISVAAYWDGGIFPWLTSAKVYDREITSAERYVTQRALAKCHLPRVQPGAVLIAITGQGKTLGHCAVLRIEATISQHLAYISVNPMRADPSFLRGYLETQYGFLRQIASGGGSTKGALTCSFLRELPIPLPPTVEEQSDLAAILNTIDHKIGLHKRKKAVLQALFATLVNNLMTGEIRVADLDVSTVCEDGSGEEATE